MWRRSAIPAMGVTGDVTTRSERMGPRPLSPTNREVIASHDRAPAVILIGYNQSETDFQQAAAIIWYMAGRLDRPGGLPRRSMRSLRSC